MDEINKQAEQAMTFFIVPLLTAEQDTDGTTKVIYQNANMDQMMAEGLSVKIDYNEPSINGQKGNIHNGPHVKEEGLKFECDRFIDVSIPSVGGYWLIENVTVDSWYNFLCGSFRSAATFGNPDIPEEILQPYYDRLKDDIDSKAVNGRLPNVLMTFMLAAQIPMYFTNNDPPTQFTNLNSCGIL